MKIVAALIEANADAGHTANEEELAAIHEVGAVLICDAYSPSNQAARLGKFKMLRAMLASNPKARELVELQTANGAEMFCRQSQHTHALQVSA